MSLHFDAQLTALGTVHRRQLLAELLAAGADSRVSVDAFADRLDGNTRQTLLQLYHIHVPLLAEQNIVATVDGGDAVCRGDAFEDLRPLLELLVTHGEQWPTAWGTTHDGVLRK